MNKICFLNRAFVFVLWVILSVGVIVVSEEGMLSHAAVSNAGEPAVTASQTPASDAAVEVHTEGEVVWTYHKDTKCLVISGKGNITFDGKDNSITDSDGYPWNVWYKQCY